LEVELVKISVLSKPSFEIKKAWVFKLIFRKVARPLMAKRTKRFLAIRLLHAVLHTTISGTQAARHSHRQTNARRLGSCWRERG
jgi:hypothetical protein